MRTRYILVAGIVGTSSFTLFSFLMSRAFRKKFQQQKLLAQLIDRTIPGLDTRQANLAGLLLHYVIGIAFSKVYQVAIDKTAIRPTAINGLLFGAVSSLPAMVAWHLVLENHPQPPRKPTGEYYSELIFGHVIFGIATFLTFHSIHSFIVNNGDSKALKMPGPTHSTPDGATDRIS